MDDTATVKVVKRQQDQHQHPHQRLKWPGPFSSKGTLSYQDWRKLTFRSTSCPFLTDEEVILVLKWSLGCESIQCSPGRHLASELALPVVGTHSVDQLASFCWSGPHILPFTSIQLLSSNNHFVVFELSWRELKTDPSACSLDVFIYDPLAHVQQTFIEFAALLIDVMVKLSAGLGASQRKIKYLPQKLKGGDVVPIALKWQTQDWASNACGIFSGIAMARLLKSKPKTAITHPIVRERELHAAMDFLATKTPITTPPDQDENFLDH